MEKAEESQEELGTRTSQTYLVRLQQQVERRRTDIDVARKVGQRRPREDTFSEKREAALILKHCS